MPRKKKMKQNNPSLIHNATYENKYIELKVWQEVFPNVMYCFGISRKPQNILSTFLQESENTVSEDGLTDHDGIYALPG